MKNILPSWDELYSDTDFGDIRRNARAVKIAETIDNSYEESASASFTDSAGLKAASRFVNTPAVTPDKLLAKFIDWNFKKLKCKHALIVQDTTEFNFSWRKELEGLGPITKEGNQGFFLHPGIIVNPANESVLGLASANFWKRNNDEKKTEDKRYQKKPIEEKESYRWLMLPEEIQKYMHGGVSFTVVADREADIYELFLAQAEGRFGGNTELLIRAFQNRRISGEDKKLFELIKTWQVKGVQEIDIETNHKRKKRKAKLEVRYGKVTVLAPKILKSKLQKEVEDVYVIDAAEKDTPEGEEPVSWTLLTTHKISSFEEALEKIDWYKCRWFIEELFRILKSGYNVEKVKFDTGHALMNWCAIRLMMAVRLLYLLTLRNVDIKNSAVPFFSKDEIYLMENLEKRLISPNSEIKRPVKKSFAWAILIISILGGYKISPSAKPPGQESLWRGLDKLEIALLGFISATNKCG
jgi:hypothetical protein